MSSKATRRKKAQGHGQSAPKGAGVQAFSHANPVSHESYGNGSQPITSLSLSEPAIEGPIDSLRRLLESKLHSSNLTTAETSYGLALRKWLEEEVTASGFIRREPAATVPALTLLAKARKGGKAKGWTKDIETIFRRMLRAASLLARPEGWLLADDSAVRTWKRRAGEKRHPVEMARLGDLLRGKKIAQSLKAKLAPFHCDEAKLAVMRAGFSRRSARVAVDYGRPQVRFDLAVGKAPLFSGEWSIRVIVDDEQLRSDRPCVLNAWNADKDGQFLEVAQEFGDGVVLERQVYLSRQLPLCLFVNVIQAPGSSRIRLEMELPVSRSVAASEDKTTRAPRARGKGIHARVLPLSVPSARWEGSASVNVDAGALRFDVEQMGEAMVLPLAAVWSPDPIESLRPWRSLTVTNDGRRLSADEAVAYRFIHDQTHVVYFHSLVESVRCAFLGHQTFHETVIGHIGRKGTFRDWLAIERGDENAEPGTAHHIETT